MFKDIFKMNETASDFYYGAILCQNSNASTF